MWFLIVIFVSSDLERVHVPGVHPVVPDGRHVGRRRVLRVAETTEAEATQQPSLHHHQAEPVRDGADEGLSVAGQADAVVHQVDHSAARQRHAAEAVQQDAGL